VICWSRPPQLDVCHLSPFRQALQQKPWLRCSPSLREKGQKRLLQVHVSLEEAAIVVIVTQATAAMAQQGNYVESVKQKEKDFVQLWNVADIEVRRCGCVPKVRYPTALLP